MNIGEDVEEIEFDNPFDIPAPVEPSVPDRELEPAR